MVRLKRRNWEASFFYLKIFHFLFGYSNNCCIFVKNKNDMKATTETLGQIQNFEDKLVKAFLKMIRGINVELSDKGKERTKLLGFNIDEPCYIKSIREDESLGLVNRSQQFVRITLSDLNL